MKFDLPIGQEADMRSVAKPAKRKASFVTTLHVLQIVI